MMGSAVIEPSEGDHTTRMTQPDIAHQMGVTALEPASVFRNPPSRVRLAHPCSRDRSVAKGAVICGREEVTVEHSDEQFKRELDRARLEVRPQFISSSKANDWMAN